MVYQLVDLSWESLSCDVRNAERGFFGKVKEHSYQEWFGWLMALTKCPVCQNSTEVPVGNVPGNFNQEET